MTAPLAITVLGASTVIGAYLILLVGDVLPGLFARLFPSASVTELDSFIPAITAAAARYSWAFAAGIILTALSGSALISRRPLRAAPLLVRTLSAQGLIVWAAMFCYFYGEFTGGMCLHHGPEFELRQFVRAGWGAFPATFAALVGPTLLTFFRRGDRNA
jgi:hypothetical protein